MTILWITFGFCVPGAFYVIREQKFGTLLKLQLVQLEVALKSDLTDQNKILDKIKVERGICRPGPLCL